MYLNLLEHKKLTSNNFKLTRFHSINFFWSENQNLNRHKKLFKFFERLYLPSIILKIISRSLWEDHSIRMYQIVVAPLQARYFRKKYLSKKIQSISLGIFWQI